MATTKQYLLNNKLCKYIAVHDLNIDRLQSNNGYCEFVSNDMQSPTHSNLQYFATSITQPPFMSILRTHHHPHALNCSSLYSVDFRWTWKSNKMHKCQNLSLNYLLEIQKWHKHWMEEIHQVKVDREKNNS